MPSPDYAVPDLIPNGDDLETPVNDCYTTLNVAGVTGERHGIVVGSIMLLAMALATDGAVNINEVVAELRRVTAIAKARPPGSVADLTTALKTRANIPRLA